MLCEVCESGFPLKYSKKLLSWSKIILYLSQLPAHPGRLVMSARGAATVTSISGPPDGRLTGPLASGTPDGDMRCWDSRLIDQRTRWPAYVGDLSHTRGAPDTRSRVPPRNGFTTMVSHDRVTRSLERLCHHRLVHVRLWGGQTPAVRPPYRV